MIPMWQFPAFNAAGAATVVADMPVSRQWLSRCLSNTLNFEHSVTRVGFTTLALNVKLGSALAKEK